jgi:hypothetical protein
VVPESKRQSVEWKHPTSLAKKKFKPQSLPEKVMMTVLLGFTGPSMETLKRGAQQQTVPVTVEVSVACVACHATFFFLREHKSL